MRRVDLRAGRRGCGSRRWRRRGRSAGRSGAAIGAESGTESAAAKAGLRIPLIGTAEHPRLDVDAMVASLPPEVAGKVKDWISRQQAAIRAREAEAAQREKEKKVQEMIRPF